MGDQTLRSAVLFPGILGEDRRLRQFQAELSRSLPIETMHYPDIASPTALLSDIGELARSLCADILGREVSVEGIVLIGYSFGGCIAAEVARLLAAKGYDVGGVVIIDAPLPVMSFDLFRSWPNGGLPPRTWTKQRMMQLVEAISLNRKVRLSVLSLCGWIKPGLRKTMDRWMCKALREGARRSRWIPDMLDFPGLVILSTQFADATSEGWRKLCPEMRRVIVEADHLLILEGPALAEVTCVISNWLRQITDET